MSEHQRVRGGVATTEPAAAEVVRRFARDAIIDAEGEFPTAVRVLIQGWAARVRVLPNGDRQIFHFLLPGDICGATRPGVAHASTTVALTPARLVERWAATSQPGRGTWPSDLRAQVEAAMADEHRALLNHMVRLGRLTGYERLGHLLLELYERLNGPSQPKGGWLALPVTQGMLADALGLSTIHVNRSLRQLRLDGDVAFRTGRFAIPDPERLAARCSYVLQGAG